MLEIYEYEGLPGMRHAWFARTFREIVASAMGLAAACAGAGCSSQSAYDRCFKQCHTPNCSCLCQQPDFIPAAQLAALDAGPISSYADAGRASIPGAFAGPCFYHCPSKWGCDTGSEGAGLWCYPSNPTCTGRRPAGLVKRTSAHAHDRTLGTYFAEMACLEAASVSAFRHLGRELVAHRAPARLVRAAQRSARDEIRHARTTAALARRYGARVVRPTVHPQIIRGLEAIAIENAVEGCAREAFGALVATFQASTAGDAMIRAALRRIAADETRHALLAFQVAAWLASRLDAQARVRADAACRRAIAELEARVHEAPTAFRTVLGLPSAAQARVLAQHLARVAAVGASKFRQGGTSHPSAQASF